ncbi:MAG: site-specific DNA-methyltransferase [Myxococcota bacterium]|nr:site-specific DNA-methyltransferase [Myxococcota bacterium]
MSKEPQEEYGLNWRGKAAAFAEAARAPDATLVPQPERSLGWDRTANLFIEGDNLPALKLLREDHAGQVGMIYIDPPYNTGQQFTYDDRFADHSRWLSMMAPRLVLARELLRDDGLLFVSIDENEHRNLLLLLCEIFGEEHYLGDLVWKKKSGGGSDAAAFIVDHEYIPCFRKTAAARFGTDTEATVTTSYPHEDERGRYSLERLDKQNLGYEPGLDFPIEGPEGRSYTVHHKDPKNKRARWRWSSKSVSERYDELVFRGACVYTKNYEKKGARPRSLLVERRFGRTRSGKHDLQALFDSVMLDYPKPVRLLRHLIRIASQPDSLVLDFFAGSGTTAQAVLEANQEDGGTRRWICAQLDEAVDPDCDAAKMGLSTISQIAIERIRRASASLPDPRPDEDRGFRVFSLG